MDGRLRGVALNALLVEGRVSNVRNWSLVLWQSAQRSAYEAPYCLIHVLGVAEL